MRHSTGSLSLLLTAVLAISVSAERPYYTQECREDAGFDSKEAVRRQLEAAEALGMSVVETIELPGNILLEMRICPAGEFPLGSPDTEKGREKDEALRHGVFPHPIYLSTCPLTQEQYQAIMHALPAGTELLKPGYAARVSYAQTRQELIPAMQKYARKGGVSNWSRRIRWSMRLEQGLLRFGIRGKTKQRFRKRLGINPTLEEKNTRSDKSFPMHGAFRIL